MHAKEIMRFNHKVKYFKEIEVGISLFQEDILKINDNQSPDKTILNSVKPVCFCQ